MVISIIDDWLFFSFRFWWRGSLYTAWWTSYCPWYWCHSLICLSLFYHRKVARKYPSGSLYCWLTLSSCWLYLKPYPGILTLLLSWVSTYQYYCLVKQVSGRVCDLDTTPCDPSLTCTRSMLRSTSKTRKTIGKTIARVETASTFSRRVAINHTAHVIICYHDVDLSTYLGSLSIIWQVLRSTSHCSL